MFHYTNNEPTDLRKNALPALVSVCVRAFIHTLIRTHRDLYIRKTVSRVPMQCQGMGS